MSVQTFPDGREVCASNMAGNAEYLRRTEEMWERQHGCCAICITWIPLERATFEHQAGRGMGGAHRDDRSEIKGQWFNAVLCAPCNSQKGSWRYQWLGGYFIPAAFATVADAGLAGALPFADDDAPWLPFMEVRNA